MKKKQEDLKAQVTAFQADLVQVMELLASKELKLVSKENDLASNEKELAHKESELEKKLEELAL